MSTTCEVLGTNASAKFTLKVYRGERMALLAMNWKEGLPPRDFVGFGISYREPGGDRFYDVTNRLAFPGQDGEVNPRTLSSKVSPLQMFRWVHFPYHPEIPGEYEYRVTPIFMNKDGSLAQGDPQTALIELSRETIPGLVNVAFTRGFVSSQAFADRFSESGNLNSIVASPASKGLTFVPTHPKATEALAWMGFEARTAVLELLDKAVDDAQAEVRVVAYDLNEPGVVSRLEKLGSRLKIIIDDSKDHGEEGSAENQAEERLITSAGKANVVRQHMSNLQHNKTIAVNSTSYHAVALGSTNFSWRGFFVQSNSVVIINHQAAVKAFFDAFDDYCASNGSGPAFGKTGSSTCKPLGIDNLDINIGFSPFSTKEAMLDDIASDISAEAPSSLFYSLAFLSQTGGALRQTLTDITSSNTTFVYGISDKKTGGFELLKPDGNPAPVYNTALHEDVPEPFKSELSTGTGTGHAPQVHRGGL